jgi:hypothetical protein
VPVLVEAADGQKKTFNIQHSTLNVQLLVVPMLFGMAGRQRHQVRKNTLPARARLAYTLQAATDYSDFVIGYFVIRHSLRVIRHLPVPHSKPNSLIFL